jgi:hypothetical protein
MPIHRAPCSPGAGRVIYSIRRNGKPIKNSHIQIKQVKSDQEHAEGIDEDHSENELKPYRYVSFRISSPRTTVQSPFDG